MKDAPQNEETSRWLSLIRSASISVVDAQGLVDTLRTKRVKRFPNEDDLTAQSHVADAIIEHYCQLAALTGAGTAFPGMLPGPGTAVAIGAGSIDLLSCMKFQVDMCRCLAINYGQDLTSADAEKLALLVAFSATIEKTAGPAVSKGASKAAVTVLQKYLKGAVLTTLKQMLKKIGINFTRKSLEKAIPFGVGIVVSYQLNKVLTRYVGRQAKVIFQTWDTVEPEPPSQQVDI